MRHNFKRIVILFLVLGLVVGTISVMLYQWNQMRNANSKKDDEKTEEVTELPDDLAEREALYQQAYPEMDPAEVHRRVLMNLDKKPYDDAHQIQNPGSMTILVNKYHYLSSSYEPEDLTTLISNPNIYMREEAAKAMDRLISGAAEQGFNITVLSGYRSWQDQKKIYESVRKTDGAEIADGYWSRPGFSESQTGLSADIMLGNSPDDLNSILYDPNYQWVIDHLADYGFVLRFDDGKQDYTLILPQSFHIRYVGGKAAREMKNGNLCLEEYLILPLLEAEKEESEEAKEEEPKEEPVEEPTEPVEEQPLEELAEQPVE